MSYSKMISALNTAYADASLGLTTIYEGTNKENPNSEVWAKVSHMPIGTESAEPMSGGLDRFDGIMQIDIFAPANKSISSPSRATLLGYIDTLRTTLYAGAHYNYLGQTIRIMKSEPKPFRFERALVNYSLDVYWYAYLARPSAS